MTTRGFTLIETLVAVTLLSIAITAPMTLTTKSLAAAYYARDQITAFHLAQEALEAIRHARDHNVLLTAMGTPTDLLSGIPETDGDPFTVDTRNDDMQTCPPEGCDALSSNGSLYGYPVGGDQACAAGVPAGQGGCWAKTKFTRVVTAEFVDGGTNEVKIIVTVSWRTGAFQARTVTISENLYRWVEDGEG
jgi:prepilin-type N-terminal cleavage/methylation domain-containing protein